jgi:cytochrome c1
MKKIALILFVLFTAIVIAATLSGCATTNAVADKLGVQLWAENCNRCHNAPSPTDFSDAQWEKIGSHMKIRANLTDTEVKKIVEFIQSAN